MQETFMPNAQYLEIMDVARNSFYNKWIFDQNAGSHRIITLSDKCIESNFIIFNSDLQF
jgi:acyl-CoA thioesterase FadM